jgi:hypothetical protein
MGVVPHGELVMSYLYNASWGIATHCQNYFILPQMSSKYVLTSFIQF